MMYRDKNDLLKTMRRLKICVLIPTYNNAGTLRHVISEVLNYSSDVIVVNDGSTDSTSNILESLKDSIQIISYEKNRGKGFALKTGFKKALELGYEYAITIDSDGQHYAEDLPKFVRAIGENYGALIIGERDLSNVDINEKSAFANQFSNFWFHVQTGRKLNDTQTGYRAYPLKRLHGLQLLTNRYEAELGLLVFASWHGVRLISIPIKVYYPPQAERISHFKPALDFTRIGLLNTLLCGAAILYGLPVRIWNAISQKKVFSSELKFFTHKDGKRKEAAITIGRLVRSLHGITFFTFWSLGIFTPMAYIYSCIGKNTENQKLRFHKMLQWISIFLTKRFPGCKTTFVNAGNEAFEKPALIICNHQSHLDIPVLLSIHPRLILLTNDWVWNNPFYGKIIRNAEFLPVSAGMDVILPHLKDLKARGYSIVVFPEGTRSADCSISRFHQGAFLLAQELGLDIVPMVLHGAGHYLPKNDFMFRKGEITLSILPRVSTSEHADLALRERASFFRKLIRNEYNKLVAEKETDSYFQSLIRYKYAYRGWATVSRCKKTLREAKEYAEIINEGHVFKKVRIINSGIGTFALLYALVNKSTEVYAYESNLADHKVASDTASLPNNLYYTHAVWESELNKDDEMYDLTIILHCDESTSPNSQSIIHLPLNS